MVMLKAAEGGGPCLNSGKGLPLPLDSELLRRIKCTER